MSCAHGHIPGCLQCKAVRAHRRSLSNLETIVGFAALLRAHAAPGTGARTVKGSIIAAASGLALENLGAVPRGGLGRAVAVALDRQRCAEAFDVPAANVKHTLSRPRSKSTRRARAT